jgi:hypothetical protein
MNLSLKDFYFSIKADKDTNDFSEVEKYLESPPNKDGISKPLICNPTLHYVRAFIKHPNKKWFMSLNWAAILFTFITGPSWFLYRRMYWILALPYLLFLGVTTLYAILCAILIFGFSVSAENFLFYASLLTKPILYFSGPNVVLSLFGDALYIRTVYKRFSKGKTSNTTLITPLLYCGIIFFTFLLIGKDPEQWLLSKFVTMATWTAKKIGWMVLDCF